jgi:hypothetical protein
MFSRILVDSGSSIVDQEYILDQKSQHSMKLRANSIAVILEAVA